MIQNECTVKYWNTLYDVTRVAYYILFYVFIYIIYKYIIMIIYACVCALSASCVLDDLFCLRPANHDRVAELGRLKGRVMRPWCCGRLRKYLISSNLVCRIVCVDFCVLCRVDGKSQFVSINSESCQWQIKLMSWKELIFLHEKSCEDKYS